MIDEPRAGLVSECRFHFCNPSIPLPLFANKAGSRGGFLRETASMDVYTIPQTKTYEKRFRVKTEKINKTE